MIKWWNVDPSEWESGLVSAFREKKLSYGSVGASVEEKLKQFFKREHAQLFSSGTAALISSFAALGLKAGDEVLIPRRTFIAPLNALHLLKLSPVMIDVGEVRPTVTYDSFLRVFSEKTKAVCLVHLNGRCDDLALIVEHCRKHQVPLVEDCSQAFGSLHQQALLGTQGDISVFSFGVTKAMTCGQGGVALTNNPTYSKNLRNYIFQGRLGLTETSFPVGGGNFRLSDLLSSLLIPQIDNWKTKQQSLFSVYASYQQLFQENKMTALTLIPVYTDKGELPLWPEIVTDDRQGFRSFLETRNIEIQFLPEDLQQSPFPDWKGKTNYPISTIAQQGVILPCGPDLLKMGYFSKIAESLMEWEKLNG